MLFRLVIRTSDAKAYSNILVEYPNVDILTDHIDNPGGAGYRLTEILSVLYPDITTISNVSMLKSSTEIEPTDNVIRYNLLKNQ